MTDHEIYKLLKILDGELVAVQGRVNLSEPCHVTEFEALRNGDTVKIRILDSGSESKAPQFRYNCEAWIEDDTGRRSSKVVTVTVLQRRKRPSRSRTGRTYAMTRADFEREVRAEGRGRVCMP